MMGAVVSLSGDTLPATRGNPDSDVIDTLRMLLEKAEAGLISGLAYATVEQGSMIVHDWSGAADGNYLMASVNLLHHSFMSVIERATRGLD